MVFSYLFKLFVSVLMGRTPIKELNCKYFADVIKDNGGSIVDGEFGDLELCKQILKTPICEYILKVEGAPDYKDPTKSISFVLSHLQHLLFAKDYVRYAYNSTRPTDTLHQFDTMELKDQMKFIENFLKGINKDIKNRITDKEDGSYLFSLNASSVATDVIILFSKENTDILLKYATKNLEKNQWTDVPGTLLKQGTIPLLDFVVNFTDTSEIYRTVKFHVHPNYHEICNNVFHKVDRDVSTIGTITYNIGSGLTVIVPIMLSKSTPYIHWMSFAVYDWNGTIIPKDQITKYQAKILQDVDKLTSTMLKIWYGVQMSLLNPKTVKVYNQARKHPFKVEEKEHTENGKRKVLYVKHYYVPVEDIENLEQYEKLPVRKVRCNLWYVIGHYRKCKNGEVTFIKGYWKGRDRNIVGSVENYDARERDISILK